MTTVSPRVAVVGYASLDSATAAAEFRGIDATTVLRGPLVARSPGIGGIAHITAAVASTGARVSAVSWVGDDQAGRRWLQAVTAGGASVDGVVVAGRRSPAATLLYLDSGRSVCLFDPGDCHSAELSPGQRRAVQSSDWVLVTVGPSACTEQVLELLPETSALAWAVKHDDDAYTPSLLHRLLDRADVVSFSRGERDYLTLDGAPPERSARPGALVLETRGAEGVAWSFASPDGGTRRSSVGAVPVDVADSTGAGDTFIGALVGLLGSAGRPRSTPELDDGAMTSLVATAARTAGAMLLRRTTADMAPGTTPEGEHR